MSKLLTTKQAALPLSVIDTGNPKHWQPHTYQRRAMKFLLENACAALWLDPGLGKTSVSLGAFKILRSKGVSRKMLVIAPLRVCYLVWPREAQDWADFNQLKVSVLHGPKKDELLNSDADIYVINPEGLQWLMQQLPAARKGVSRLRHILDNDSGAILCVDEVTKFKNTQSQRFKLLKPALDFFGRRWTLTGTCAPNGFQDLFGQIYVVDQGNALGRYITQYRATYFDAGGYGNYTYTLKPKAEVQILKRLQPLVMRMSAEDYLTLPALLVNKIEIDLPPDVRKLYDQMEDEMLVQLGDDVFTAMGAAAASIKCRQIANGGLYHNDNTEYDTRQWRNLHTAKVDALAELVESVQGRPVFFVYEFHHDLDRIRQHFGKDIPILGGKGSGPAGMRHDKQLEAAWNADQLPLMGAHPASVAHGLNLQKSSCQDIAMHSDTWDQELYDQVVRRVCRQGSKQQHVRVHHFVVRDTVDVAMFYSHAHKAGVQRNIMDAIRRGRKMCK